MDTPVFHLDGMGNRMLIAIVALVHLVISHPLAVGTYPLVGYLEWKGIRAQDRRWDQLAKRITFVTLLITSSFGVLSLVGLWLASALVMPLAVGSVVRMFFWNCVGQWMIFIVQVGLLLAYYQTWDRWQGRYKRWHMIMGIGLSLIAWVVMTSMATTAGSLWTIGTSSAFNGSRLLFLFLFSLTIAGLYVWFLMASLLPKDDTLRPGSMRLAATWTLVFTPLCMATAYWVWQQVPQEFQANFATDVLPAHIRSSQSQFLMMAAGVLLAILAVAVLGRSKPRAVPRLVLAVVFIMAVSLLGHGERMRELTGKPYIIPDYLYANGVRVDRLALYQHEGVLAHSAYKHVGTINDVSRIEAGKHVFLLTCTRCHTTSGMGGVVARFEKLYGLEPWDAKQLDDFLVNMHITRPYMPPFPGNDDERRALSAYLCNLQQNPQPLPGAQSTGIAPNSTYQLETGQAIVAAVENKHVVVPSAGH